MTLKALEKAIRTHAGEFTCERINGKQRRTVTFAHAVTPPGDDLDDVPEVGRLREFYGTFGSVLFYLDEKSGEAAKYLAPVSEWETLSEAFSGWTEDLDEDEREEIVPEWVESCLVVGETPHSGNYILVATEGEEAGRVFEFDHDGFEFVESGKDIVDYSERLLKPDGAKLTDMASHMRFAEGDRTVQWWILELRDNTGHTVATSV